jgi:hypothetical protein
MSEPTSDTCAAYGCPLLGVYGESGKWYCCCHHNTNPALNDAITLEIHRQQPMADHIVSLRRMGKASRELEGQLMDLVREIGQQTPIAPAVPNAKIVGPTHAMQHYTEVQP